jgi:hypothetical protein
MCMLCVSMTPCSVPVSLFFCLRPPRVCFPSFSPSVRASLSPFFLRSLLHSLTPVSVSLSNQSPEAKCGPRIIKYGATVSNSILGH